MRGERGHVCSAVGHLRPAHPHGSSLPLSTAPPCGNVPRNESDENPSGAGTGLLRDGSDGWRYELLPSCRCCPYRRAKDTLRIDRAFIGTTDAWRDVTAFLRQQLSGDALAVTIAQPFTEIGGDPASGKVKNLIVDYRLNGRAFRLWLEERYPVAFTIQLPSPNAKAPGADSKVRAMLKNIFATLHVVAEGDPLPDLAPLGLGSDVAPTNKPILLCLFDSQQRPSRHFLRQVTGQHEALRQKGLMVLGVQAAVIDSRSFQQWKGSNAFPFPVGQVAEESEQTAWVTGVASLPWLVLTDAQRRIAAEGFALEEIDAKLKAVEK